MEMFQQLLIFIISIPIILIFAAPAFIFLAVSAAFAALLVVPFLRVLDPSKKVHAAVMGGLFVTFTLIVALLLSSLLSWLTQPAPYTLPPTAPNWERRYMPEPPPAKDPRQE